MRRLALILCLLPLPLQAETLSQEIGHSGLAAVEARLSALPLPSDEERFTLGGVQFLRAVEISFQDRWRQGLTDPTGMLPFLRLPMDDNPTPEAFTPETIVGIFRKAEMQLALARANLLAVPEISDFAAEISLRDIWFDVDASGARDPGEGLTEVMARTFAPDAEPGGEVGSLTIRFDVADAAWLAAYADLLSAVCDVVRAYDPTEPVTRVLAARAQMATLGPLTPDPILGSAMQGPDVFDLVAMVLATLDQTPDAALTAEARTHLLDMVAENRAFWSRVAKETDNQAEWLPNAGQQSVLGVTVPPEAQTAWAAVLDEMEAVLLGDRLIPYWRVGAPAGINLARFFTEPRPIDVAGWAQGWAALPYLETGTLASGEALMAFDAVIQGDTMLFAIWFN